MSFAKTFQEAKARYKPMRRTPMRSRSRSSAKPARSRMKRTRRSPEDDQWRDAVLERDGRQCRWIDPRTKQRCRRRGKKMHAHHIRERTQRPDLIHDVDNGATICPPHHDYAHHDPQGRKEATEQGLLGGETYEAAQKRRRDTA